MAGNSSDVTIRIGRALVLLFLVFVVASLVACGLSIALTLSVKVDGPQLGFVRGPSVWRVYGTYLVLSMGVVLIVRWFLLKKKPQGDARPVKMRSGTEAVQGFIRRFLPGLAGLKFQTLPAGSARVSHGTLFLNLGLLATLDQLAARFAGVSSEPEQPQSSLREQTALVVLAHEEFHLRSLDARFDAGLRALVFVLLLWVACVFPGLVLSQVPEDVSLVLTVFLPLWLPPLLWLLIWSAQGGPLLIEHLADAYALQRLRPAGVSGGPTRDMPSSIASHQTVVYLDSREHHPSTASRMRFTQTFESWAVTRLIVLQSVVLLVVGVLVSVVALLEQRTGGVGGMGGVLFVAVTVAALAALAFAAVAGALVPILSVVVCWVLALGVLLLLVLEASAPGQLHGTPWLLLALLPAAGLVAGRVLFRSRVVAALATGAAPADLPLAPGSAVAPEEALRLALTPAGQAPARQAFFPWLLSMARTHGRFLDISLGLGLGGICLGVLLLGAIADFFAAVGFAILMSVPLMLVGLYFSPWAKMRSGIAVLWGSRMMLLVMLTQLSSILITFYLHVLEYGGPECTKPGGAVPCLLYMMDNLQEVPRIFTVLLGSISKRCLDAGVVHKGQFADTSVPVMFAVLQGCAFATPGRLIGPLALGLAGLGFLFDTSLSWLRWLGVSRPRP